MHQFARIPALLATVAAITMAAAPASAKPRVQDITCSGRVTNTTVQDVLVTDGSTCTLRNVTVRGDVSVQTGGTLNLVRSTVRGAVDTARGADFGHTVLTIDRSTVRGTVHEPSMAQATVTDSTLGGITSSGGYHGSSAELSRTVVTGDVDLQYRGTYTLDRVTVKGDLAAAGWTTTVRNSTVRGKTTFGGQAVTMCGSRVRSVDFGPGYSALSLGGEKSSCRGNTIRGDLTVKDAYNHVSLFNNVVTGRTTSPETADFRLEGRGNRFRGGVTGVFASLR